MQEEYWTTKDGKRIAVGDMDEQHVRNALRMVLRNRREERYDLAASDPLDWEEPDWYEWDDIR